jgi:hypothetical protein
MVQRLREFFLVSRQSGQDSGFPLERMIKGLHLVAQFLSGGFHRSLDGRPILQRGLA